MKTFAGTLSKYEVRDAIGRFVKSPSKKKVATKTIGSLRVVRSSKPLSVSIREWSSPVEEPKKEEVKKPEIKPHKDGFGRLKAVYIPTTVLTPWPGCCGASIVSSFGYSNTKKFETEIRHQILATINQRRGMISAIINQVQVAAKFDKVLQRLGFQCISGSTNPNHSDASQIYLYVKVLGKQDLTDYKKKDDAKKNEGSSGH